MSQTIGDVLREAQRCLEQHGIPEPRAAAEVLLADLLAMPRLSLHVEAHHPLSVTQHDTYTARIKRRLWREPVQYITGTQEFWSLEFRLDPHVLIPRPETELLVVHGVQRATQWCGSSLQRPLYVLDVGTGSGNVAISLAHALPHSRVWGIDIVPEALRVAQENARRLAVAERVTWVCGDLVTPLRGHRFALCVGNLPYITTSEWVQLPPEIKDYEPPVALCGGEDGLNLIRHLIAASPAVLAPRGTLLLEVGWQQAAAVVSLIRQQGSFHAVGIYRDFAGIDRAVWAQRPS